MSSNVTGKTNFIGDGIIPINLRTNKFVVNYSANKIKEGVYPEHFVHHISGISSTKVFSSIGNKKIFFHQDRKNIF